MMTFKAGDVVLVPFPFTNLSGSKKRPALVLVVARTTDLICMMLTSSQQTGDTDYAIAAWHEAGLLKPTVARISRLFTLDRSLVIRKLGSVNDEELREIVARLVATMVVGKC